MGVRKVVESRHPCEGYNVINGTERHDWGMGQRGGSEVIVSQVGKRDRHFDWLAYSRRLGST